MRDTGVVIVAIVCSLISVAAATAWIAILPTIGALWLVGVLK